MYVPDVSLVGAGNRRANLEYSSIVHTCIPGKQIAEASVFSLVRVSLSRTETEGGPNIQIDGQIDTLSGYAVITCHCCCSIPVRTGYWVNRVAVLVAAVERTAGAATGSTCT